MDSKDLKGQQDCSRASENEGYEIQHLRKNNVTPERIRKAIQEVGNMCEDVEENLKLDNRK